MKNKLTNIIKLIITAFFLFTGIFPINSPKIDKITVVRKGKVRRAKLNYLRTLKKQAKIKERN